MNVGLLGGTFSPPTMAHLWIAQQILEDKESVDDRRWQKMDHVWIVPNSGSDHYGKKIDVDASDRLAMCQLMVKDFGNPSIEVLDVEIEYKMTYTYQLADFLKTSRHYYHLIIGGDWDITKFKEWERITEVFKIIQVHRPGLPVPAYIPDETGVNVYQDIQFDLSSSIIRERVAQGKTIKGLVTPSVENFIREKKLFSGNKK